jgi:hypothetical protein
LQLPVIVLRRPLAIRYNGGLRDQHFINNPCAHYSYLPEQALRFCYGAAIRDADRVAIARKSARQMIYFLQQRLAKESPRGEPVSQCILACSDLSANRLWAGTFPSVALVRGPLTR